VGGVRGQNCLIDHSLLRVWELWRRGASDCIDIKNGVYPERRSIYFLTRLLVLIDARICYVLCSIVCLSVLMFVPWPRRLLSNEKCTAVATRFEYFQISILSPFLPSFLPSSSFLATKGTKQQPSQVCETRMSELGCVLHM
jgi:hypothetical protein